MRRQPLPGNVEKRCNLCQRLAKLSGRASTHFSFLDTRRDATSKCPLSVHHMLYAKLSGRPSSTFLLSNLRDKVHPS